jgi:hypothetical protein
MQTSALSPKKEGKGDLEIEGLYLGKDDVQVIDYFKQMGVRVVDALQKEKKGSLNDQGMVKVSGLAPGPAAIYLEDDPRDPLESDDWNDKRADKESASKTAPSASTVNPIENNSVETTAFAAAMEMGKSAISADKPLDAMKAKAKEMVSTAYPQVDQIQAYKEQIQQGKALLDQGGSTAITDALQKQAAQAAHALLSTEAAGKLESAKSSAQSLQESLPKGRLMHTHLR